MIKGCEMKRRRDRKDKERQRKRWKECERTEGGSKKENGTKQETNRDEEKWMQARRDRETD